MTLPPLFLINYTSDLDPAEYRDLS
jgi:hypothetical protein